MDKTTCLRCGGTGEIPRFRHVLEGVCFRCWGSGFDPQFDVEGLTKWLGRARKEYRNLVTRIRTAPPEEAAELKRQLQMLTREGKDARARLDQLICESCKPAKRHLSPG